MKTQNYDQVVTHYAKQTWAQENGPHSLKQANSIPFKCLAALATAGALLAASNTQAATTLTFEDLAVGETLANQYSGLGVTFSSSPFTGAGGPSGDWASNTDMQIVSSTGADVGGLGSPSLVSGNILRSFAGWLAENGDPSFLVNFSAPVSSFSAEFSGVATPASTRLFLYDGATLLDTVVGSVATGQFVLSYASPSITSVVITPGDFNDWVGVDNITFEPVPEPGSLTLAVFGGLSLLVLRRRAVERK